MMQLIDSGASATFKLGKKAEVLTLAGFELKERLSFLDYIMGGCEIGVQVAVDFTLSNGAPHTPGSLHRLDPRTMSNRYTEAIREVVGILEAYDHNNMIPVYGFGAILPG